jgi:hypothetical protein
VIFPAISLTGAIVDGVRFARPAVSHDVFLANFEEDAISERWKTSNFMLKFARV